MAEALGHPEHGYYRKGDPFGGAGDFVTAPEISQMFGELLGFWSAVCWRQLGAPACFNLIELGPGRGTLMADGMRAGEQRYAVLQCPPRPPGGDKPAAAKYASKPLSPAIDRPIHWHDQFVQVPDGPFVLLANEFLDALPIRQFAGTAGVWRERLIDLTTAGDALEWTFSALCATDGFNVPPVLAVGVGKSNLRGLPGGPCHYSRNIPHDHDAKRRGPVHRLWICGAKRELIHFRR